MSKRIDKLMLNYSERDFEALLSIYNYRCLSFEQIYNLHYKTSVKKNKDVTPEYLKKKITKFKNDNLIEESTHIDKNIPILYSVTQDGVKFIKKYFSFPTNIYNEERRIMEKGYLTYSEVKISYKFMPHQYNLNSFALDAENILQTYNIEHNYYDEKHIPKFENIRPDAMINTPKMDIYLEMDMGTETKNQLYEKWNNYRSYLSSSKNDISKRKIILFICHDKTNVENRIKLIKDTIRTNFLDCVNDNLELYVGTPKKLLAIIKGKIIHEYFDLVSPLIQDARTAILKNNFRIEEYSSKELPALFKIKHNDNGMQLLVQEFFGEPISTIQRIDFFDANSVYLEKQNGDLPMLVIATNEESLINNYKVFNIISEKIYFTTIKRLENLPLNKAIFKINNDRIYCFKEDFKSMEETTILK